MATYVLRFCYTCGRGRRCYWEDNDDGGDLRCGTCGSVKLAASLVGGYHWEYEKARGILPLAPGDPLPEETIREMRDEW